MPPPAPDAVATNVAVLGGGWAGVSASHVLGAHDIDFILVEGASKLGGRSQLVDFEFEGGYRVEECSNWIQGVGKINNGKGNDANPIWELADKYGMRRVKKKKHPFKSVGEGSIQQDYESYIIFDTKGKPVVDQNIRWDALESAVDCLDDKGLELLRAFWDNEDFNATSQRDVLSSNDCGWVPKDSIDDLIEYWEYDWEWGTKPDTTTAYTNPLFVYTDFGPEDEFVVDQCGYQFLVESLANETLQGTEDPRLWLDSMVTNIEWDHDKCPDHFESSGCVLITTNKGTIVAEFAIVTFSPLVLKYDLEHSKGKNGLFNPDLPKRNSDAVNKLGYGLYNKMFMQFEENFWGDTQPPDLEFILTATEERGFSPVWQNLDTKTQLDGSRIIFQTLTEEWAERAEAMDDEAIIEEHLEILKNVYGEEKVSRDKLLNFYYVRLLDDPLKRGAWGSWSPDTPPDNPERLRTPIPPDLQGTEVQKVWISGSATCRRYGGFTTGAYIAGKRDALEIANIMGHDVTLETICESREDPGGTGNGNRKGVRG
eukprot:CAMPEP_0197439884 /NCGR_PEP_ID=MMETSP1175-20131217/6521_1 /TAXON_ID=1003142 /ORGANISM="Triceratium dubium, Strain CCMP147" /LENGTH=539 /DNA_ID=CAMNT_0042969885 /DNA_START=71 /DNA_END=1690 /DNA_ORIENTATION=+